MFGLAYLTKGKQKKLFQQAADVFIKCALSAWEVANLAILLNMFN